MKQPLTKIPMEWVTTKGAVEQTGAWEFLSIYLAQFTGVSWQKCLPGTVYSSVSLGTVSHKRLSEHAKIDKSLEVKNTNEYFIFNLLL